ncbi:MAG: GTPase ObgE [bacterium]
MFLDKTKILVVSGHGGNGCISFRREKYIPYGGPNGGDGGKGGNIILKSESNIGSLRDFIHKKTFRAQKGQNGQGQNKHGKNGEDLIINIPLGTIVKNSTTNEIIADFVKPNQEVIICKSGIGGKGNQRFSSSTNQAPRIAEKGEPGHELEVILELKIIADIGLIGMPNAGKSTFLSQISNAKPKIASYPFTTLSPNIGIVEYKETIIRIADIPGLIEGAHKGIGLGIDFLRHIERTKVLVYIIDLSNVDLSDPLKDFNIIKEEIKAYNPLLLKKPSILIGNKIDLDETQKKYEKIKEIYPIYPISALTKQGCKELIPLLKELLEKIKTEKISEKQEPYKYTYEPPFVIKKQKNTFFVNGQKIKRIVSMTNLENPQAIIRLHNIFKKEGIIKILKKMGIKQGEMINIENYKIEWDSEKFS